MFPNTRELFNLKIALINELNTFKIIEEPKEELEEIELLDENGTLKEVTIKNHNKINELIANQNKMVKEIKANKEQ